MLSKSKSQTTTKRQGTNASRVREQELVALRLARVLGMPADFWLGLQQDWDLWHAMRSDRAAEIEQLQPLRRAT